MYSNHQIKPTMIFYTTEKQSINSMWQIFHSKCIHHSHQWHFTFFCFSVAIWTPAQCRDDQLNSRVRDLNLLVAHAAVLHRAGAGGQGRARLVDKGGVVDWPAARAVHQPPAEAARTKAVPKAKTTFNQHCCMSKK